MLHVSLSSWLQGTTRPHGSRRSGKSTGGRIGAGVMALVAVGFVVLPILLSGCGSPPRPEMVGRANYECEMGMRALDSGDFPTAHKHFLSCLNHLEDASCCHQGLALCLAEEGSFDEALKEAKRARRVSKNDCASLIATGRVYLKMGEHAKAAQWFRKATKQCPQSAEAFRWLGRSLAGEDWKATEQAYRRALEIDPRPEIEREWRAVQAQRRAHGAEAILLHLPSQDTITRGELAALLDARIALERLRRVGSVLRPDLLEPGPPPYVEEGRRDAALSAPDVPTHWAAGSITKAVALGVMRLRSDGRFHPEDLVSRAELAETLVAALSVASGNRDVFTLLSDIHTPIEDLPRQSPYFAPVMVCLSRGLMEVRRAGFFEPEAPATGAEAVLGVTALQETLGALGWPEE